MAPITINGVSWDPVAPARSTQPAVPESTDAAASDYILVQTADPLTDDQRQQLADLGVEVLEYVPDDTYLCRYRPTDLDSIRALPFVVWADIYFAGFKLPPALRPPDAGPASPAPSSLPRSPSRKLHEVDVVLHDGVSADAPQVRARIAAVVGRDPDDLQVSRQKVRLTVQEDQLAALAELDEVRAIEETPQRQLFNNVARSILNAEVVAGGTRFEGDGQIVAVADTGFDRGSTSNVHPAFTGRVLRLHALGRPTSSNDPHGHGTHVAGSVLGDGTSATMGGPIRGTAPRAKLVLQSTLDGQGGLGGIPADLRELFGQAYDDGARVHTNSWGNTRPGRPYDQSAREIDDMVWQNQDLVICFAAGNDGIDRNANGVVDAGSIGSESAAKNCITVGASESERPSFQHSYGEFWPGDFPAAPIRSDLQADDPDGMVAFSSRGPTKEGRIKPDVVAPGTCILSALSRAVQNPSNDFGTSTDRLYFFDSGTSMATPLVAGCVAVLRESLIKNGTTPSAALVKAMLINGAVDLPGQYSPSEAGSSPNNSSGFGRVDLARSVILPADAPLAGFVQAGPLAQGAEHTFTIDVSDQLPQTLKITLVWTDPPGAALQNDLDLIVRAGGQERHGNTGASPSFDRVNNVEQVRWIGVPAGPATVVVRAFRITTAPQPFACAWRIT